MRYLLLVLALCGCTAGAQPFPVAAVPVVVDNRNFYDARIRINGSRLGLVTGHTLDTLWIRYRTGLDADVVVELVGGGGRMDFGRWTPTARSLHIYVAPYFPSSQVWVQ